jgi:hypothetical protein
MMDYLQGSIEGFKLIVEAWYNGIFNQKVPRGICWLIMIILIPVNIIGSLIWRIFDKDIFDKAYVDTLILAHKEKAE